MARSTYDRTQNCTNAPNRRDQRDVDRAFFDCGDNTEECQSANIHAATSNTSNGSTNNEYIHCRRSTRDGATDLEDGDAGKVEPFDVK